MADLDNELVQRRRLERHSRLLAGGFEIAGHFVEATVRT
jgi:hypothetical protein